MPSAAVTISAVRRGQKRCGQLGELHLASDKNPLANPRAQGLFENRGNDEFLPRRGSFQGKTRKAIFRLARIFDAERGPFWVKRRRFRFFKQALPFLFFYHLPSFAKYDGDRPFFSQLSPHFAGSPCLSFYSLYFIIAHLAVGKSRGREATRYRHLHFGLVPRAKQFVVIIA